MSSLYNKCAICGLENPEPKHYWTNHRIKEQSYYEQYWNKKDLLTNEPLTYKSRDQYIWADFNNKINLKKWLSIQDIEKQKEYLKEILCRRRDLKNLLYIPTQVELRSMDNMVGIKTFNDIFGDYYQLCKEIGLKDRGFININSKSIIKSPKKISTILIDSRERDYIQLKNFEIATVPVGDYTLKNNNENIFIERKSFNDFLGTFLPSNLDRFKRELTKAKSLDAYIIMLVETSFNNTIGFEYNTKRPTHTKATSTYIFHNVRETLQEFDNFQICFCDGRKDLKDKMIKIFECGLEAKKYDWQLIQDLKLINNGI